MKSIQQRVAGLDWGALSKALSIDGYAVTPVLLSAAECAALIEAYEDDTNFRSRIVMARLGFGRGEYKYFNYPLPEIVSELRQAVYPKLAPVANVWGDELGGSEFPLEYAAFKKMCHEAGQTKPTPLLLKYQAGDYNCLHQDLYGAIAFPFQMTVFLSRLGADYSGGEFVLVEQRPRMQSRATVITAKQGEALIFATRYRPVRGTRGVYRTNLRHGVSTLRHGSRFTLGIIFHDAE
jgi:hypothetical protein